jgi:hypothetical protein
MEPENTMSYVIFSIDFENNPHRLNIFQNYCHQSRPYMVGNVIPCFGKYEGEAEHSFLCAVEDFEDFFRKSIYLKGQESILHVASGNKMEVSIEYLDTGTMHSLGNMHQVTSEEALAAQDYTYLPSTGNYYVCKRGNPDGAYERSVQEYRGSNYLDDLEVVAGDLVWCKACIDGDNFTPGKYYSVLKGNLLLDDRQRITRPSARFCKVDMQQWYNNTYPMAAE